MTNLFSITGDFSALDRLPPHFYEAVCMWHDRYCGMLESEIAAKYGTDANSVASVLMELKHEGAEKLARGLITEGFEPVHV